MSSVNPEAMTKGLFPLLSAAFPTQRHMERIPREGTSRYCPLPRESSPMTTFSRNGRR